jgi:multisubunit Na+/H+ antiporter MnhF subunit
MFYLLPAAEALSPKVREPGMDEAHPAAVEHLPAFITAPGHSDVLFIAVIILVLAIVLMIGNLYLRLHALPERLAHGASKIQFQIVAVLALIALFTHNHLFWIAALLLAFVQFPDFSTPVASIARSLEKLANRDDRRAVEPEPLPSPEPNPQNRQEQQP